MLIASPGSELPLGFRQRLRGACFRTGRFQVLPSEHPGMFRAADTDDPLQVRELRAAEFAGTGGVQFRAYLPQQVEISAARCRSMSASPRTSDCRSVYSSSAARYAGLMVTRTTPMRAVANWSNTHCGQFVDHTPKWSPRRSPIASNPRAMRSTSRSNSAHVRRTAACAEDHRVAVGKPPRRLPQRRPDGQTFDPRFVFREQAIRAPGTSKAAVTMPRPSHVT